VVAIKHVYVKALNKWVLLQDRASIRRKKPAKRMKPRMKGQPPATPFDYTKANTLDFPLLGNGTEGDCMAVGATHGDQTFTGMVGTEATYTDAQIIAWYLSLTGGQDIGLDMDTLMAGWKTGIAGTKAAILDDMTITPSDSATLQYAMQKFGGGLLTMGIPDAWLTDALNQPGATWDGGAAVVADDNNGHGVWLNGWDGTNYKLQTWGFNPPIVLTPAGLLVCDPAVDVVFSLDWFDPTTGLSPNGDSYDTLAALWVAMGGNPLPPNPFNVVPTPTPTPIPVPPGPPTPVPPPVPVPPPPPGPVPTPGPTPSLGVVVLYCDLQPPVAYVPTGWNVVQMPARPLPMPHPVTPPAPPGHPTVPPHPVPVSHPPVPPAPPPHPVVPPKR
jgi:hypothetical protein